MEGETSHAGLGELGGWKGGTGQAGEKGGGGGEELTLNISNQFV